jgi:hypothetical protein
MFLTNNVLYQKITKDIIVLLCNYKVVSQKHILSGTLLLVVSTYMTFLDRRKKQDSMISKTFLATQMNFKYMLVFMCILVSSNIMSVL